MEQSWNDLHGFESRTTFGVAVVQHCLVRRGFVASHEHILPPKQQQCNNV